MAKFSILAGTTSKSVKVFVQNSSVTTGAGLTGLVFNTSGLTAYYIREGAATTTQITLVTATLGTWTSGGFIVADGTNMPGIYELDLPDAAIAAGAKSVLVYLQGATNMAQTPLEIELTAVDNQNATTFGLSALPNAAAGAANGLHILGTNATAVSYTGGMTYSNATGSAFTLTSSGSNGNGMNISGNGTGAAILATGGATGPGISAKGGSSSGVGFRAAAQAGNTDAVDFIANGSGTALSLAAGATGVGLTIAGGATSGAGVSITTTSGDGVSILPTAGNGITVTANGTSKHGIVSTGGTAGTSDGIKAVAGTGGVDLRANITGNVTGSLSGSAGSVTGAVGSVTGAVGSVTGAVGSVTGAVTVGTNNDKTGYALTGVGNNSVADALLDRTDAIETSLTPRLAWRYAAGATAGIVAGAGTGTVTIQGAGVGTTRITATVDANGNRSAVTLS